MASRWLGWAGHGRGHQNTRESENEVIRNRLVCYFTFRAQIRLFGLSNSSSSSSGIVIPLIKVPRAGRRSELQTFLSCLQLQLGRGPGQLYLNTACGVQAGRFKIPQSTASLL